MSRFLRALVLPAVMLLATSPAHADIILFTAELTGEQEVPVPVITPATGFASMTFDDFMNVFSWNITYSGLLGTESGAHFHAPAPPGVAAAVVIPLVVGSPIIGSFDFDDFGADAATRESQLLSGLFYVNIHTVPDFPGGEIRGQVLQVPEPTTLTLLGIALAGLALRRRRRA